MYNKVLVPLDGSERAEAILPHVQDIARRYKAEVILLSVLEYPHTVVAPDGIYVPSEEIIHQQRHDMEEYLKIQQQKFQEMGLEAEVRVAYGRVIDAICEISEEEKVDLVAIASHGRTGLGQVFYGSVAAGVLHRIDRPLLLVRAE